MNMSEHLREAERAREVALQGGHSDEVKWANGFTGWTRAELLSYAQLHATLALVASRGDQ